MKSTKTSFLFFYIIYCLFFFIGIENVLAQESIDSLKYYSLRVLNPKNGNDLSKAYKYFSKCYDSAIKNDNIDTTLRCLYFLSSIDYKNGDYTTAEKTAVKGLKIIDNSKSLIDLSNFETSFYNLLGNIYNENGNKDKTLKLYNKVLSISDTAKDSLIVFNNISILHKKYNETTIAQDQLLKALKIFPRVDSKLSKALVLDNLGVINSLQNNPDGLVFMKQALELREQANDTSSIYTSYSHLAKYFNGIGNANEARKYALKANELANKINSASYRNDALGLLTDLSEDEFAKAYKKLNDSLYKAEKDTSEKFALMKYDLSKSELKTQEANAKSRLLFVIASFLIILGFVFYFLLRSKHRRDKLQQAFSTESQISKKVHDEIANEVFHIMMKLQSINPDDELIDDMEHIYHKTRDISKEHSLIDLKGDFQDILNDLILSYNDSNTNVIVKGNIKLNWANFSEIKRITIYKVVQELLINMKKHSKASIVVLTFETNRKTMYVNYSDNGIGGLLKKGTGLRNVENRIASLNGTTTFETEMNKGFKAKFKI
ncbi:ATP-binding protein [Psychroserpens sp. Hel_I_66]|uniref:tetratricopeptide repeat-containing sensor histidine kinase n=1 Tax=Psychroserpens sp. Hel_I_66 TaxID=1250004 RepID=UPI0006484881|nr:ATP-binding protein [Psychroserpens sp. Hel_I_66]